jgi:AraC-like DNA-binding protein
LFFDYIYHYFLFFSDYRTFGGYMYKLQVRDDMSEGVRYTSAHLPVYSVVGRLSSFLMYSADCHWHRDLEFIVILEGEMTYHVNDRLYPLRNGDGIFVNANRLHFGAADAEALKRRRPPECVFLCLLLHPSLLCAHPYIETHFVNPLLYDSRFDALFFPASAEDWRTQALERIRVLMELTRQAPDDSVLEAQSRFYDLISLLFANTVALGNTVAEGEKSALYRDDLAIKQMIGFIQKHFNRKITLDEIAHAGAVCRNKCCRLFKQALRKSVFDYLLHFRIRQSLGYLTNEKLSVTDVALASGFSSISYYGEIFKRLLGISPGEYRRKLRDGGPLPLM